MAAPIFTSTMSLKPGSKLKIIGDVSTAARVFIFDLGKDSDNFALHCSVRFNHLQTYRKIVCNTMVNGKWGKEKRETYFPFYQGSKAEICIEFDESYFKIGMPGGFVLSFPNRTATSYIAYFGIHGDIKVRLLAFE